MYFGHGLELSLERTALSVLVFAYAHIPLLAALTAVGAGITLAIEQSSESGLDAGTRWALAGGTAVYLVCLTIAQQRLTLGFLPRTGQSRLAGAAVLVTLALVGGEIEPLAFTALTTGVLVALVVFKMWSTHRLAVATDESTGARAVEA